MASIVSVVVSDDLDGSEGAQTVQFGIDGVAYEIDLAEKNRAKLDKAISPYLQAARRVNRRASRSGARFSAVRSDRAAVRAWAKEQGLAVSERGRISADVMQRYEAAH
jgi:Spy/CpxP family protein refolding chaperone